MVDNGQPPTRKRSSRRKLVKHSGGLPEECWLKPNSPPMSDFLGMVSTYHQKMVIFLGDGGCRWHWFTHMEVLLKMFSRALHCII